MSATTLFCLFALLRSSLEKRAKDNQEIFEKQERTNFVLDLSLHAQGRTSTVATTHHYRYGVGNQQT
jgi:hypothetical protein